MVNDAPFVRQAEVCIVWSSFLSFGWQLQGCDVPFVCSRHLGGEARICRWIGATVPWSFEQHMLNHPSGAMAQPLGHPFVCSWRERLTQHARHRKRRGFGRPASAAARTSQFAHLDQLHINVCEDAQNVACTTGGRC